MPVKKSIKNKSLIQSSWVRWITICDNIITPDINKTIWIDDQFPYIETTIKELLLREYSSLCCGQLSNIPEIKYASDVKDDLHAMIGRVKKTTEKALTIIEDPEATTIMKKVIVNCEKAVGLIEHFPSHEEMEFYWPDYLDEQEEKGENPFKDMSMIWSMLQNIGTKAYVKYHKEEPADTLESFMGWYKNDLVVIDNNGYPCPYAYAVTIPNEYGILFYVFNCLMAVDHRALDGMENDIHIDRDEDVSKYGWISLLREDNPEIQYESSSEGFIEVEDRKLLEDFLERKTFEDIIGNEELFCSLRFSRDIDIRKKLSRLGHDSLATLKRLYLSLDAEYKYLVQNEGRMVSHFPSFSEEESIREKNKSRIQRCENLNLEIMDSYSRKGSVPIEKVAEYILLFTDVTFEDKPELNCSTVYNLIERYISRDKELMHIIYSEIHEIKRKTEIEGLTHSATTDIATAKPKRKLTEEEEGFVKKAIKDCQEKEYIEDGNKIKPRKACPIATLIIEKRYIKPKGSKSWEELIKEYEKMNKLYGFYKSLDWDIYDNVFQRYDKINNSYIKDKGQYLYERLISNNSDLEDLYKKLRKI